MSNKPSNGSFLNGFMDNLKLNPAAMDVLMGFAKEEIDVKKDKGKDGHYEHQLKEKVEWMIDDEHLTPNEVVRRAVLVKEKGKAFLRQGELQRAGICYLVSKLMDPTQAAPPNNCAEVMLRLYKYPFAEVQATEALKIEPNNVKALFRRGKARMFLNKLKLAEEDLDAALLVSQDAAVTDLLADVRRLIALNMSPSEPKKRLARLPKELEFPGPVHMETASNLGLMIAGEYNKGSMWKGM